MKAYKLHKNPWSIFAAMSFKANEYKTPVCLWVCVCESVHAASYIAVFLFSFFSFFYCFLSFVNVRYRRPS